MKKCHLEVFNYDMSVLIVDVDANSKRRSIHVFGKKNYWVFEYITAIWIRNNRFERYIALRTFKIQVVVILPTWKKDRSKIFI